MCRTTSDDEENKEARTELRHGSIHFVFAVALGGTLTHSYGYLNHIAAAQNVGSETDDRPAAVPKLVTIPDNSKNRSGRILAAEDRSYAAATRGAPRGLGSLDTCAGGSNGSLQSPQSFCSTTNSSPKPNPTFW